MGSIQADRGKSSSGARGFCIVVVTWLKRTPCTAHNYISVQNVDIVVYNGGAIIPLSLLLQTLTGVLLFGAGKPRFLLAGAEGRDRGQYRLVLSPERVGATSGRLV